MSPIIYCTTKHFRVCLLSCQTCTESQTCKQYAALKMSEDCYQAAKEMEINLVK